MRHIMTIAAAASLLAAPAFAQNPPAKSGPGNAAVNTQKGNDAAPVEGANSFTEGQAKSKLESNGFTNVSALKKDDAGIWRGKAEKNAKAMDVSIDFKGNVISR